MRNHFDSFRAKKAFYSKSQPKLFEFSVQYTKDMQ